MSQLKDLSVRKLQSSQLLTAMEAGILFSWLHEARIFGDPWIKTRTVHVSEPAAFQN